MPQWLPELDNLRAAMRWSRQKCAVLVRIALLAGGRPVSDCSISVMSYAARPTRSMSAQLPISMPGLRRISPGPGLSRTYVRQGGAGSTQPSPSVARGKAVIRMPLSRPVHQGRITERVDPQTAAALIGEIVALESPDWPPRVRCMRWRALYTVEIGANRWPQALHAAETGLELAIQAGATVLKGALQQCRGGALDRCR